MFCGEWSPIGTGLDASSLMICDAFVGHNSTSFKHVVFVLDEASLTREVIDVVMDALDRSPDDIHVALVLFSASVKIFEMGGSTITAECISADSWHLENNQSSEVEKMLREHETSDDFPVKFVAPMHLSRSSLKMALEHHLQSDFGDDSNMRCFGGALETALALLNVVGAPCGSLVVVTSGAPSFGPGAMVLVDFESLAGAAKREADLINSTADAFFKNFRLHSAQDRVGVDIFCVSDRTKRWAIRQLCDLGRVSLRLNLDSVLQSLMREPPGTISVRTTKGISQQRVLEPLDDFAEDALTMLFDAKSGGGTIQLSLRSTAARLGLPGLGEVERTVTKVVIPAQQGDDVAADDRLAAVLIGKEALVLGGGEKHICSVLKAMAGPHVKARRLPASLVRVASMLFHMARGSMFRGHPEEMDALRARFVHAPLDAAIRIMMPQLWGLRWARGLSTQGTLQLVPLSTLSMRSDYVLVLDAQLDVYTWIGSDVPAAAQERSVALNFAKALARDGRWPVPQVVAFEEKDSFARCVRARLSPEHKDTPDAQLGNHPLLAEMSPDQLAKFRARLFSEFSDDPCFSQWMSDVLS